MKTFVLIVEQGSLGKTSKCSSIKNPDSSKLSFALLLYVNLSFKAVIFLNYCL